MTIPSGISFTLESDICLVSLSLFGYLDRSLHSALYNCSPQMPASICEVFSLYCTLDFPSPLSVYCSLDCSRHSALSLLLSLIMVSAVLYFYLLSLYCSLSIALSIVLSILLFSLDCISLLLPYGVRSSPQCSL